MTWIFGLHLVRAFCGFQLTGRSVLRLGNRLRIRIFAVALCLSFCALTLSGANQPPSIPGIPDHVVIEDQPTEAIQLGLSDAETSVFALQLSGASSNPTLVPTENIFFGTAGAFRYLTVTPAFGQTGTATITVTVSDGQDSTSTNFLLTVNPPASGWSRFFNSSSI